MYNSTCYWPYAANSSNICSKHLEVCLGVPGTGSFRTKKNENIFFLRAETPDHYWPFWRPVVVVRHVFAASASPRGVLGTKKWLCHPLPLFTAVSMILTMCQVISYRMRHSWLTQFGAFSLNRPITMSYEHRARFGCEWVAIRAKVSRPCIWNSSIGKRKTRSSNKLASQIQKRRRPP